MYALIASAIAVGFHLLINASEIWAESAVLTKETDALKKNLTIFEQAAVRYRTIFII